jgi:hypothetical protein
LVGCSQNPLTTRNQPICSDLPQVKGGTSHTALKPLIPGPPLRAEGISAPGSSGNRFWLRVAIPHPDGLHAVRMGEATRAHKPILDTSCRVAPIYSERPGGWRPSRAHAFTQLRHCRIRDGQSPESDSVARGSVRRAASEERFSPPQLLEEGDLAYRTRLKRRQPHLYLPDPEGFPSFVTVIEIAQPAALTLARSCLAPMPATAAV